MTKQKQPVQMGAAARHTIAVSDVQPSPTIPDRWVRNVRVLYLLADGSWRPALEGETCSQGGGGHGEWKTTACKAPAVVTRESMRGDKPYRSGRCEVHAGGRLPLEDGRVIEPVSNPLGGA